MSFLACGSILAAILACPAWAAGRFDLTQISEHWGSRQVIAVEWVLVAAGLLLLIIAALSLRSWWMTRHLRASPLRVFNQVAVKCGLTARERLLLWRIARHQGLPSPLTLMVCPITFGHHGRAYCRSRGSDVSSQMRQLARLRRRLFAER